MTLTHTKLFVVFLLCTSIVAPTMPSASRRMKLAYAKLDRTKKRRICIAEHNREQARTKKHKQRDNKEANEIERQVRQ